MLAGNGPFTTLGFTVPGVLSPTTVYIIPLTKRPTLSLRPGGTVGSVWKLHDVITPADGTV
jgi:hypothetical protein